MDYFENSVVIEAAHRFGTPLYLYSGEQIRATYQMLKKMLPRQIDIFYSMKANPLLSIGELLQAEQASCEVCSYAELYTALKAGFAPENIIFVGPGKSVEELELCVTNHIYAVVCESINELILLNQIAEKKRRICSIILRINPEFLVHEAPLKMGGKPTQFGMDLAFIRKNIQQIVYLKNIKIIGIHIYNGTRILEANAIIENTRKILQLAEQLSHEWAMPFECIDIGGGLGIPYFLGEKKIDLLQLFSGMSALFNNEITHFPNTRFILECGRYLVGEAGVFITKVVDKKISYGENFIITDGGMNCHMAATGIASFVRRNFPIDVVKIKYHKNNHQKNFYNITGLLCTPGDVLARQIEISHIEMDDFIVVKQSGAYGPSASPGRFLSHGFPAEVLFYQQQLQLVRRRETVDDILSTQNSINLSY